MKKVLIGLAALALAGCSSTHVAGSGSAVSPSSANSTTLAAPTTSAATSAPAVDSSSSVEPDQCLGFVGEPTSTVVDGASTTTSAILHCITGLTLDTDHTKAGVHPCTTREGQADIVYYWGSDDAASPDQNIYAGKKDGTVIIVPDEHANTFWILGGGLASIALATNCI